MTISTIDSLWFFLWEKGKMAGKETSRNTLLQSLGNDGVYIG
jgi:hypothetical protein